MNLSVPGEYEIIITLAVSEENKVSFSLPERLQKIRVPVKISDPDAFELWITKYDNDSFYFDYLKQLDSSFKLYTLESETELPPDELPTADWSVDTNGSLNTDAHSMSVLRRNLTVGHYYYYQIRSDSCSSTIVMLQDNGEKCSYASIGGNRDGSSDNPGADDVIQPAPAAPAEKPSQPETSAQPETPAQPETSGRPETTAPMESFTEDSDTIYGTRLDLSRKNHGGSASFSKHDIQATLSSDALDSLDIGASDSLTVEIKQETPSSVTISVSKNGETVAEIPDTQITAPVNGKLYSFTVQETGTYELPEREVDSESTIHTSELPPSDPSGGLFNRNGLPFYLGLSALSLGGAFLILRRRIFR